jgi:hypothetical protein
LKKKTNYIWAIARELDELKKLGKRMKKTDDERILENYYFEFLGSF